PAATVPTLVGLGLKEAQAAADKAGLLLKTVGDPKQGKVLSQNPPPNTPLKAGMTVTATFPAAATTVSVPILTGLSFTDAKPKHDALRLVTQTKGDPKQGKSVSQAPPAGTKVKPGATVVLTFPAKPA